MTEKPPKKEKKRKTWKIKTKKKTIEIPVKEVVEISIFIVVLFMLTFGTFFILQASLKTKTPMVVVISGSMEPTIYRGDLLFVKGTDPTDINNGSYQGDPAGDIIVFDATWSYSGEPIVHRVIDKRFNESGSEIWEFKTQGDNTVTNPSPDPGWTSEEDVIGVVVWKVPKVGYVKIWLSDSGMAIPVIIILSLVLVISIVYDLTHPEKEDKEKKSKRRWFKRKNELEASEEIEEIEDINTKEESDENKSVNLGV